MLARVRADTRRCAHKFSMHTRMHARTIIRPCSGRTRRAGRYHAPCCSQCTCRCGEVDLCECSGFCAMQPEPLNFPAVLMSRSIITTHTHTLSHSTRSLTIISSLHTMRYDPVNKMSTKQSSKICKHVSTIAYYAGWKQRSKCVLCWQVCSPSSHLGHCPLLLLPSPPVNTCIQLTCCYN